MTNGKCQNNVKVEWYSGNQLHTHPIRIKIDGLWKEVFQYEKIVREEISTKKREVIFRCHIGDNQIVEITGE